MKNNSSKCMTLKFLPVDFVVFPYLTIPLYIEDPNLLSTIDKAIEDNDDLILFLTKKNCHKVSKKLDDLFSIGTICQIVHKVRLPDGFIKILVKGLDRGNILYLTQVDKFYEAQLKVLNYTKSDDILEDILITILLSRVEKYIKLKKTTDIPIYLLKKFTFQNQDFSNIYTLSTYFYFTIEEQINLLSYNNFTDLLKYFISLIVKEIDILILDDHIHKSVKKQLDKTQREFYLNEQMRSIQDELNKLDRTKDENELLKKQILSCGMSKEALDKALSEFNRLKFMSNLSAEATVTRAYLEWLIKLPWKKLTPVKIDLTLAKSILDKNHFGLEEVKERILEYLAVQSRNDKIRGPIICLVGPPGVGKTSLGESIAKALGRKYVRISLGGLHDEAEIRGHRRTYIGALPGRIIQKLSQIKVKNPVFLLDEIDKISSTQVRGDPEYALLEVLDPEQNSKFSDNYLEVDFDLSKIMFIATANSLNISDVLRDRMEIIRVNGYTENEKKFIAKKYLINKYLKNNRIYNKEIIFSQEVITNIIRFYTMESGVRDLERNISKIFRKALKKMIINRQIKQIEINNNNLKNYLGMAKYDFDLKEIKKNTIGQVTGLAWTEYGGDTLLIETAVLEGKGELIYTGSLGKIMQESIKIALTVVRLYANQLKINDNFYKKYDLHVHVTEGAIPKDGPSAGIAICTALVSSFTKNPIKTNIAMTGEITLFGKILPIGGLREKLLAATRTKHIKKILIPKANLKDLYDIPDDIKSKLQILSVSRIEQVLEYSLLNYPF